MWNTRKHLPYCTVLCNSDDGRRVSATRIFGNNRRIFCVSWIVIRVRCYIGCCLMHVFIRTSQKGGLQSHVSRTYCQLASFSRDTAVQRWLQNGEYRTCQGRLCYVIWRLDRLWSLSWNTAIHLTSLQTHYTAIRLEFYLPTPVCLHFVGKKCYLPSGCIYPDIPVGVCYIVEIWRRKDSLTPLCTNLFCVVWGSSKVCI